MKKLIILIIVCFLTLSSHAQNQKPDSAAIAQQEASKFVDSLVTHTTLKQFNEFLYENVSQKTANEGKFVELYNLFLQQAYQGWLQRKAQPKTLPVKGQK